jgi:hypothetical protein
MENKAQIDGNGNIVIQNVDGSTIIVNPDNTDELKKLIINLGNELSNLPQNVLQMINDKQDINKPIENGANVYLTVLMQTTGYGNSYTFRFGVTVTNLTNAIRYFNQPFFKVNPPFELKGGIRHDTFMMIDDFNDTNFPVRLEYGQPISASYPIKEGIIENYKQILSEDEDAYVQCFVNTTVGELFESNKYKVSELLRSLEG